MSSIQILMPVSLTTPGRRWIISTWVITPILLGGSVTAITTVSHSGSVIVIHRGITRITIMAIIRHGMPHTIIIIPVGTVTGVTAQVTTAAVTTTKRNIVVTGTTGTPATVMMTATTVQTKTWLKTATIPNDVTEPSLMATVHLSGAMCLQRLPGIQAIAAWWSGARNPKRSVKAIRVNRIALNL